MSIAIAVRDTKFYAKSTVNGTITLHGDGDIRVGSIEVCLTGRSKTKITNKSSSSGIREILHGGATLVHQRLLLVNRPSNVKPGHSWSFSFIVPSHCSPSPATCSDSTKQNSRSNSKDDRQFNHDSHQLLPSAMADAEQLSSISRVGCSSSISYQIEARMIKTRPAGGLSIFDQTTEVTAEHSLNITPTRNIFNPDPELANASRWFEYTSFSLLPEYHNPSSSDPMSAGAGDDSSSSSSSNNARSHVPFRNRLKNICSTKPSAWFYLHLTYPQIVVLRKPLPLALHVVHDSESSTCVHPPRVFVRKISVDLVSTTAIHAGIRDGRGNTLEAVPRSAEYSSWETVAPIASDTFPSATSKASAWYSSQSQRSSSPSAGTSSSDEKKTFTSTSSTTASSSGPSMPELTSKPLQLLPLFSHVTPSHDPINPRPSVGLCIYSSATTIPTFRTMDVNRTYRLKVMVAVTCTGGKELDTVFRTEELLVLPAEFKPEEGNQQPPPGDHEHPSVTTSRSIAAATPTVAADVRPCGQESTMSDNGDEAPPPRYEDVVAST